MNIMMYPQSKRIVAAFAILGITAMSASAVNVAFVPGDSYFVFRLTQERVDELNTDLDEPTLVYDYPIEYANLSGYVGFERLRLVGDCRSTVQRLTEAYRRLRKIYPKKLLELEGEDKRYLELNGLVGFVCRRDADLRRMRMGLRYNETWNTIPKSGEHGERNLPVSTLFPGESRKKVMREMPYRPLLFTKKSVVEDWRHAADYKSLPVKQMPDVAWAIQGPPIREPLSIDVEEVQIVVLARSDIKPHYNRSSKVEFYSIAADHFLKCRWKKRSLETDNLLGVDEKAKADD